MTNLRKDKTTAQLADNIIGAAQALEKAAKGLREQAKAIRAHGVFPLDAPHDTIEHYRSFKAMDVRQGAEAALRELGQMQTGDYLTVNTACRIEG